MKWVLELVHFFHWAQLRQVWGALDFIFSEISRVSWDAGGMVCQGS